MRARAPRPYSNRGRHIGLPLLPRFPAFLAFLAFLAYYILMLRFQTTPDKIFMAILTESMEMMIDRIGETLAVHRKEEVGSFVLESLIPNAARVFAAETALKTLKHMLHCHKGPRLYRLNDYHFLLLYDTLEYFCDVHNDRVHSAPNEHDKERTSRVGAFHVEEIRFEGLIDIYFYGTDFLMDEGAAIDLNPEEDHGSGIYDEAFSIAQGLAPHPEELKFREIKEEIPELSITSRFWRHGSRVYPDR
jgi:hypothetical protein